MFQVTIIVLYTRQLLFLLELHRGGVHPHTHAQCCYTVSTLFLHCCNTVVTLLSDCCYTVVTLTRQLLCLFELHGGGVNLRISRGQIVTIMFLWSDAQLLSNGQDVRMLQVAVRMLPRPKRPWNAPQAAQPTSLPHCR
jgi:hypothetical protein